MLRHPLILAAALAFGAWHPAAHATADWLTVAPTCVPDSSQSLDFGLTSLGGGYVRSAGRNPPVAYFCPVWNPDDLAATPSWKFLKLQALDPNGGGGSVVATLYAKNRITGAVSPVTSVASPLSSIVMVTSVPLPAPLSFKRNAYYVTIQIDAPTMPAEAHMVMLTN
ncbi:MAG TPA: hypothetical protein VFY73_08480 [Ideonella sp.]|uniref:hypothetical protein n=1 Tax=Ideonella sp. TaxID=1929293 RepID=UPI002E34F87B|nr:hypothetical protein [Ideonella sp.]HEX5684058.1 hypothetical protein [Ideonella sp.]